MTISSCTSSSLMLPIATRGARTRVVLLKSHLEAMREFSSWTMTLIGCRALGAWRRPARHRLLVRRRRRPTSGPQYRHCTAVGLWCCGGCVSNAWRGAVHARQRSKKTDPLLSCLARILRMHNPTRPPTHETPQTPRAAPTPTPGKTKRVRCTSRAHSSLARTPSAVTSPPRDPSAGGDRAGAQSS